MRDSATGARRSAGRRRGVRRIDGEPAGVADRARRRCRRARVGRRRAAPARRRRAPRRRGRRATNALASVGPPSTKTRWMPRCAQVLEHRGEVAAGRRRAGARVAAQRGVRGHRASRRSRPGSAGASKSAPSAPRAVSAGSSASTVPVPTTIASASARRRCTSARASGPVIHWLVPSDAAARPSRLCAHFTVTCGRPRRWTVSQTSRSASASSASTPPIDLDARRAQALAAAGRVLAGVGDRVDDARDAGGDQRLGARPGAAGVVAGLEGDDGGRAARRAGRELRQRVDLGVARCRRRGASPRRAPRRRGERITPPTCGFTPRGPFSASSSARRIASRSAVVSPASASFVQAPGTGEPTSARIARRSCCLPSGLAAVACCITVGSGIPPDQPRRVVSRADASARGLSPPVRILTDPGARLCSRV